MDQGSTLVISEWDIGRRTLILPRSNHVYQLAPYEAMQEEIWMNL